MVNPLTIHSYFMADMDFLSFPFLLPSLELTKRLRFQLAKLAEQGVLGGLASLFKKDRWCWTFLERDSSWDLCTNANVLPLDVCMQEVEHQSLRGLDLQGLAKCLQISTGLGSKILHNCFLNWCRKIKTFSILSNSRVLFSGIFLMCGISRVCFALIFVISGISRVYFDWSFWVLLGSF